jgi:hypothetical protein
MTDTEHDTFDVAHSLFHIEPKPGDDITATALRVGHNTGQETLLFHPEAARPVVVRDQYRTAFIPLREDDAVRTNDRVMFRYVVCGPSREEAKHRIRRLIYRRDGNRFRDLTLIERGLELETGAEYPEDPFCVEIQDSVPPGELTKPGEYGFAVVALESRYLTRSQLEKALAGKGKGLLLTQTEFRLE